MTNVDLRTAIDQLGLTNERAAECLGIGVRSLYRYMSGVRPVPKPIEVAIRQQQELRRIRTVTSNLIW